MGDRVAVLSMNDTDVFELQFACRRLGAIFLPLNWRLAVPELEFIAKDAGPVVLLHGEEFADAAREVARLAGVPHTADLANGKPSAYEAGLASARGALDLPALDLADIWTIMYTSGTTGRPKGAQITYRMCVFNAVQSAMMVGLTALQPEPGVPADLPHRRPERLRQPDLSYRRLQRGDAELRARAFPAAARRPRARAHAHVLGRADQLPDAGRRSRASAAADFSHIVSLGVGGAAAPLGANDLEEHGREGIEAAAMLAGTTETGPVGLLLFGRQGAQQSGLVGPAAARCAAEDLRSRRH